MRVVMAAFAAFGMFAVCTGGGTTDPPVVDPATPTSAVPAPAPTPASAPDPAPSGDQPPAPDALVDAWMVIVAGSADRVEAGAMLLAYKTDGLPEVGNHPRLVESATVEGLNAGFWIVVAATVDNEATATTMSESLRWHREGTYVRKVRVADPEHTSCAELGDPRCRAAELSWRAVILVDETDEMDEPSWDAGVPQVRAAMGAKGIPFLIAPDDEDYKIAVPGSSGEVDVEPFLDHHRFGYVVAMQGAAPQFVEHAPTAQVVEEIRLYFTGM